MTEIDCVISPPSNGYKPTGGRSNKTRRGSQKKISSTRFRLILAASNVSESAKSNSTSTSNQNSTECSPRQMPNFGRNQPSLLECVRKVWGRDSSSSGSSCQTTSTPAFALKRSATSSRVEESVATSSVMASSSMPKLSVSGNEFDDLQFVEEFEDDSEHKRVSLPMPSGAKGDLRKITSCAGLKNVEKKWSRTITKVDPASASAVDSSQKEKKSPKRFLIIDDDPVNHTILRMMSQGKGEIVFDHTYTGIEGLTAIEKCLEENSSATATYYDGIFLDFHLPDMLGDEVCRNIRRKCKESRSLPLKIIGHSSCTVPEQDDLWEAGIDYFMEKPTTSQHFARILAMC